MSSLEEQLFEQRKNKLKEWTVKAENPYWTQFTPRNTAIELQGEYARLEKGAKTDKDVEIAGRIIAERKHGKAGFFDLKDATGSIQIYLRADGLGEKYELLDHLDLGDIIGVKGRVFKTRTGQLSIEARGLYLLAKCLRPLPEKWHGLQDIELRYRQRFLDLLVNPQVKDTFLRRGEIIRAIRSYLDERGFMEVETPMMQLVPGGATARPFMTHHHALDENFYLRIAPELYLKKLVTGGLENIYELNKNFRNEGMDRFHNPEFTMLEVYSAYKTYRDMMDLTTQLVCQVTKQIKGTWKIKYQGQEINLTPPWQCITFQAALEKIGGVKVNLESEGEIRRVVREKGLPVEGLSKAQLLEHLLDRQVVPQIIQPTFVIDYPYETAPLAKRKKDNPSVVERFELFIATQEVANAYSELNDPIEQRERLNRVVKDKTMLDEDFLQALEYGLPPTAGLGVGIDRLVMILTDSPSIRDVILFPQMRPRNPE